MTDQTIEVSIVEGENGREAAFTGFTGTIILPDFDLLRVLRDLPPSLTPFDELVPSHEACTFAP